MIPISSQPFSKIWNQEFECPQSVAWGQKNEKKERNHARKAKMRSQLRTIWLAVLRNNSQHGVTLPPRMHLVRQILCCCQWMNDRFTRIRNCLLRLTRWSEQFSLFMWEAYTLQLMSGSDNRTKIYTGLPTHAIFKALFDYLELKLLHARRDTSI